jgi:hypothetical protein
LQARQPSLSKQSRQAMIRQILKRAFFMFPHSIKRKKAWVLSEHRPLNLLHRPMPLSSKNGGCNNNGQCVIICFHTP